MSLLSVLNLVADVRTAIATAGSPIAQRMQYALLGTIAFDVVGPITGLESKRGYTYAQHDVIESKPRLQATGDELEVLTVTFVFHSRLGDPVAAYASLTDAAAQHQALPFVLAGGQVMGKYVITEIDDTTDVTDFTGAVLKRTTHVTLTEWVEDQPLEVASRTRRADAVAKVAAAPKKAIPKPVTLPSPAKPQITLDELLRMPTILLPSQGGQ